MLGPSGFFASDEAGENTVMSTDLEVICSSEKGPNVLYRGSKGGRFFVYKALKPEFSGKPLYEKLLEKEFNIGFSMTHHGVCQHYAMVNYPGIGNCIVMEWVDGCSLESILSKGKLEKRLAYKIIEELCDVLDYMHSKQIIHRDLKPENILVTYNGNNVKLIDFGLSDSDSYGVLKAPAGTRAYASPEQIAGEKLDCRSDIWALGMIIKEMTDACPYVVRKCLRRDREKRYANVREVRKAVRRAPVVRLVQFISFALLALVLTWVLWSVCRNDAVSSSVQEVSETAVVQKEVQTASDRNEDASVREVVVHEEVISVPETDEDQIDSVALQDLLDQAAEMLQ